jgi:TPR repeat protein
MAADFQDRLLDELMPAKKVKEEPAIVADVLLADGAKARLSAVQAAKTAEATALSDDAPSWRGTCAICLDALPVENERKIFYSCCCKSICAACSHECRQHDTRCPLCRAPPPASSADWVRRLQEHVDKKNAEAQFVLGAAYRSGLSGLPKSFKRALRLYELAAAQGHAMAQSALGQSYERGDGVKINSKTAAMWFRRAAEQGYPLAQYNLGQAFRRGEGVAQSFDEAVKWYRLAAAQGDVNALYNLSMSYGAGQGAPQDDHEALRLLKRAAALGSAEAADKAAALEAGLAAHSRRPT